MEGNERKARKGVPSMTWDDMSKLLSEREGDKHRITKICHPDAAGQTWHGVYGSCVVEEGEPGYTTSDGGQHTLTVSVDTDEHPLA